MAKLQIQSAINTYTGNYCRRKCFNHYYLMNKCFEQFEKLAQEWGNKPITRPEFNAMMKTRTLKICKLPFEKRKQYVSWKRFEKLNDMNIDFWQLKD